jgi:carbon-monoxide dehydrogenase large subunit
VNLGAYLGPRAVVPCLSGLKVLTGPYRIGAANARVRAVLTNTVPTCPYRGAGVPETAFVVERMVDMAARRLGLDPIEIRRRNLVGPDQLPWTSPTGATMHSVDYPAVFEAAVARFGQPGGVEAHPHAEGPRRGMGVAFTIEGYGTTFDEAAEFCVDSDGGIEVRIGTKSSGQSHETSYAQIAADALDVDPASIVIVQGDTDRIRRGHGTGASRSITTGGSAILRSAATLLNEARADASTLLQCAPDRLVYRAGCFEVSGTQPRASVDLATLARSRPDRRIHVTDSFRPDCFTFPGGCHVAEVEVDVETGAVEILRYVAVHDAGVAVNPTVVEGQLHGGIAQGIGAALMEAVRYDEVGEAVTATFLDYALPRADNLPRFEIILSGTPCASNLLGAKPVGEAGTVAAPPAILNAIVDALRGFGVEHIDLPATPERVREALERARRSRQQAQTQDRTLP